MLSQATGAQPLRIYPSNDRTWFFADDTDLQFIVDADASGRARSIVSRRPQYDTPLTRLPDAEASKSGDELDAKIRGGAPDPRAEATIRRAFDELRNNVPDYSKMTAGMASTIKQQLGALSAMMRALPPISTLTFTSVAPNGADIFEMANGNKVTPWRILLTADGRIETIGGPSGNHRPGSDATLRRVIETIAAGQPAYEAMTPARAEFVRTNLAQQQREFAAYGPIQFIWFISVDPQRGELFEVTHANARVNWTLLLDAEGKVVSLGRQPVP